ncbi:DJ-1/PfpI family protein [Microscilla marina]|nr:DJ-1/PfpI family protein [Microscilla marina]
MKNIYLCLPILAIVALMVACQPQSQQNEASQADTTVPKKTTQIALPKVDTPTDTLHVAFLIMDGTFNTELTAPIDMFQHTIFHAKPGMRVFTIAKSKAAITTFEGVKILPDYSYTKDKLPKIDVLVVPSAEHHLDTDLKDTTMINFVKKVDKEARYVTSHCDGAFVLAQAGLLDNVASTTFPGDVEKYRQRFPKLNILDKVWFVHDGKYITSAGGARSFEAALYLVQLLYGKKAADGVAKGLVLKWDINQVPFVIANQGKKIVNRQGVNF